MSILYLALLAAAVEDKKRRTNAHQGSSSKKERTNKNNDYEREIRDYYNNSMDLENFLEALLAKNTEATNLFLLLEKCHQEVDQEDIKSTLEQFQETCKKGYEQDKLLQDKIKALTSTGITLDETSTTTSLYTAVKKEEGSGFRNFGEYSYERTKYKTGFNGLPLTKEILEQNCNPFEIELETFKQENPNIDTLLSEITAKVEKQKRKTQRIPFNKDKNQQLLDSMLRLEKDIKEQIARRTTLEVKSKSFAALTEEQKKAILDYLEQIEKCIISSIEINSALDYFWKLEDDIKNRKYLSYWNAPRLNKRRNVVNRIIEKAVAQSNFSREDIERILEEIKIIMNSNKFSEGRFNKISNKPYHHPTTPESMYAATFYEFFYRKKPKTKK